MGRMSNRSVMLLPQDAGSDGDDSLTQDCTDNGGSDDSWDSDSSNEEAESGEGRLRGLVERLCMWDADMETLPWHTQWDQHEGHRRTKFMEFVQWQLQQVPDINLSHVIECLKSDVVNARGLMNSLTVRVMPTRAVVRRMLQYESYVPTVREGSFPNIYNDDFWEDILPTLHGQPCLRFPPYESLNKVKVNFYWCGIPDIAALAREAPEGVPDEDSRQVVGLLHVLHYLSLARDEHEVFTTAIGRALVKRSWQHVRWYYYVHTLIAVLFITILGVMISISLNDDGGRVSHQNAALAFVLLAMSFGNLLGDLAELGSFGLEFGQEFKRNFFVWNMVCLVAEAIVCVIQCYILWVYATDSSATIPGFLPDNLRKSLLIFVAMFKFYVFFIYISVLDIFAHSLVPAQLALVSFDSVAFLILLGLLNVAATHGFWTLPTDKDLLESWQLMSRLATVGDSDAVVQATEPGDKQNHFIKRMYILFVLGVGSVCAMNLYFGILFNGYQQYKQRWVHHYLKWLAQMITKYLLRIRVFNHRLRRGLGFERTSPAEFDPMFGRRDTEGLWIVWCPNAQPTVMTLDTW